MRVLDLYSEPFAKTGNIAAQGLRKLLGRPALGLLQTVIREALQNCVDAAKLGVGPDVLLRTRVLSVGELDVLRNRIFAIRPQGDFQENLLSALDNPKLRVFEIADFNTTGLSGPTSADIPSDSKENLNFVNFIRNVGAIRDTHHGGGTYGYGKTSLYALSVCSTILIDTQTHYDGHPVRRLMGCRIGEAFNAGQGTNRKRYTGRHWWGLDDKDEGVGPLEGRDVIELAAALGLPERCPERTGTTIMIIGPLFEEGEDVRRDLIETILWNFWPRMCHSTRSDRRISIRLHIDGESIVLPPPENFPPLDHFVNALEAVRTGEECKTISCHSPSKELGKLAISKGLRADRDGITLQENSLLPKQCSHIALMRPVELIVKYICGEPFADNRFEWAGVFICSSEDEVERAFADSEPPAHDDWAPGTLPKGRAKTFVNVALRRLGDEARVFANPLGATGQDRSRGPSLASTAAFMGRMLIGSSAQGPGKRNGSRILGSHCKSRSISTPRFTRLEVNNGVRMAVFEADLVNDARDPELTVLAEPYLVVDGGEVSTKDIMIEIDRSISTISLGDVSVNGSVLKIGETGGRLICHIHVPEDAAVGLRLRFKAESDT